MRQLVHVKTLKLNGKVYDVVATVVVPGGDAVYGKSRTTVRFVLRRITGDSYFSSVNIEDCVPCGEQYCEWKECEIRQRLEESTRQAKELEEALRVPSINSLKPRVGENLVPSDA